MVKQLPSVFPSYILPEDNRFVQAAYAALVETLDRDVELVQLGGNHPAVIRSEKVHFFTPYNCRSATPNCWKTSAVEY